MTLQQYERTPRVWLFQFSFEFRSPAFGFGPIGWLSPDVVAATRGTLRDGTQSYGPLSSCPGDRCDRGERSPGHRYNDPYQSISTEDEYIHVRFNDPDEYETIRTPDWAEDPAQSVSEGAEVRTGKRQGSDDWEIQSILIEKRVGEEKAREQADEIYEKIESDG